MEKNWRNFNNYKVYLVTDRELCLGRPLDDVVLAAVQGGAGLVQLREKHADTREFVDLARHLVQRLKPFGVPLLINDRVDVALASGAAGVHVGQRDMPVQEARALLGPHALIGLSVENMPQLMETTLPPVMGTVDYIALSPLFDTNTKKDTAPAWGLDGLQKAARCARHPLVVIGGIHPGNAPQVVNAGANGLAVVSAICSAADPTEAARLLYGAFQVCTHMEKEKFFINKHDPTHR